MTDTNSTKTSTVPTIFARLASEGQIPMLRRTSGTYEFDIDGGGRWFLTLDHGTPYVQSKVDQPTCTFQCNATDFIDIAEGRLNLLTAYLRGDVTWTGDMSFALKFRRLLPVPA